MAASEGVWFSCSMRTVVGAVLAARVGRWCQFIDASDAARLPGVDVGRDLRRVGRCGAACGPQRAPSLCAPTQGWVQLVPGGKSCLGEQDQGRGLGVCCGAQRLPTLRHGRRPPSADGHGMHLPPARSLWCGVRRSPFPAARNHAAPSLCSGGSGAGTPHAAPRRAAPRRTGADGRGRLAAHRCSRHASGRTHSRRAARLARGRATRTAGGARTGGSATAPTPRPPGPPVPPDVIAAARGRLACWRPRGQRVARPQPRPAGWRGRCFLTLTLTSTRTPTLALALPLTLALALALALTLTPTR